MAVAPAPTTTTTTTTPPPPPPALIFNEEKPIEEQLSTPILLSEQILNSIPTNHTFSFHFQCLHIFKLVDTISTTLRTLVRISTTTPTTTTPLYHRPILRITSNTTRTLHRTLSLLRLCRRRSFLLRIIRIITLPDFRKVFTLLDSSIGDLQWLVSILDFSDADGRGVVLSLPPIASNDPILSWVWSYIACVQMGCLCDRIEAATELGLLANDSDRNKKMIVEEGGVMPLLRLLKEEFNPAAQTAAAVALFSVVNDVERVRVVVDCMGVPLIVKVLNDATIGVQVRVAELVGRMAEFDSVAEEFARENVIRPLVSLLSFETFDVEFDPRKFSFHSIVEINKEKEKNARSDLLKPAQSRLNSSFSSVSLHSSEGGSSRGHNRKDRENASVEMKMELKISCSRALWMLAKDSVSNSRRITETKGLLCLAKLIEKEKGVLQKNCLMAIMEITLAAELNSDLRRSAFKTNSHAGKAVVDQLIRVVTESNDPTLQIPGLRSIGCLSRTFPARETRVISPLVDQLSNNNYEVATEAAIALGKFACPDNFLHNEHSKSIIEFDGVLPLMRLLRGGERAQVHGLILLCYLAIHTSNHEVLEQARVLNALEGADRTVQFGQKPHLRELISKAIYHLNLYRNDINPLKQPSLRIY